MYFEGRDYLWFVFYDKVLCMCISGYIKFVLYMYINYKIFDLVYIYLFVYMFLSL